MSHPSFIIGAISFVLLIVGVLVKSNGFRSGDYIIIASTLLGFIHWIWSIIDVVKNKSLDGRSRPLWLTMVVIIPPLGGMFYYMMRRKNVVM